MSTLPEIELDPIQHSMLDFWRAERGDRRVPLIESLDPLRFDRRALPFLVLADILDDRGLVKYRLVGEEMVRRWGSNFRGRRSDELFSGDYRVFLERGFALARSERCPIYSESIFRWNDGGSVRTSRLLLPFSEHPDSVPSRVAVVQIFLPSADLQATPEIRLLRGDDAYPGTVVVLSDQAPGLQLPDCDGQTGSG